MGRKINILRRRLRGRADQTCQIEGTLKGEALKSQSIAFAEYIHTDENNACSRFNSICIAGGSNKHLFSHDVLNRFAFILFHPSTPRVFIDFVSKKSVLKSSNI